MAYFDLAALARAIDVARIERGLTWAALARDVGVSASTIRRFEGAADAEADGVLALLGWLGSAPEAFVSDSRVAGQLLPPAGAGMIRVDMETVAKLPSWPRSSRAGSRTTMQRLVAAAQHEGVTIASLTRWAAT